MSFSRTVAERLPLEIKGVADLFVYKTGAGTPVETDTKPDFVGQEYLDTSEAQFWKATGAESPADFKRITSDNP